MNGNESGAAPTSTAISSITRLPYARGREAMSGAERPPASEPAASLCAQCGGRIAVGSRFCPGCGRPTAGPVRPGESSHRQAAAPGAAVPADTLRGRLPGLAVLAVFLAVGLGIWVSVLRPGAPTSSAPSRSVPPRGAGAMPPDHPPIVLPDEAKKLLDSLAATANAAPTDVSAWRNLAQAQTRAAEIEPSYGSRAVESYRHVLGLAPDDTDALRGLGNLHYDQRQYASATEHYERYLKLKPDDVNVRTDLATAYLYQRQVDRAIELYEKVIETNPTFIQAHFNLGLAYEAKGDRDKALASLAKARTLAADDAARAQIDRVVAQLTSAAARAAGPGALADDQGAGVAPAGASAPAGGAGSTPAGAGSTAGTFRDDVEAALRGQEILGPKITAIEWPEPTRARVLLTGFPMQAMPEGARGVFRGRLETVLGDAKARHGVSEESAIDLVDAATGTSMELVTR
jgi:cytochrome c-type biogenesis protein CcmH/NrfG